MGGGVNTKQIKDGQVMRDDLNYTKPTQSVVRKVEAGNGLYSTEDGADKGTGDVELHSKRFGGTVTFMYSGDFQVFENDSFYIWWNGYTGQFEVYNKGSFKFSYVCEYIYNGSFKKRSKVLGPTQRWWNFSDNGYDDPNYGFPSWRNNAHASLMVAKNDSDIPDAIFIEAIRHGDRVTTMVWRS